ncbi:MAG: PQQ-binding-like beta-propeller repeat protein [Deltaproteobacteria bacterium]|nr:PQQ-binding-like beta-propeller repeat protein [Deltaproteobacteria bacterium]
MRRPRSALGAESRRATRLHFVLNSIACAAALLASCGPPTKPRVKSSPPTRAPAFVAQAGHFAGVRDLSFSPDSDVVASVGGVDRAVNLWNTDEGGLLAMLREDGSLEWTVAFGSNDDRVASGGTDGWIRIWNPDEPETSIASWKAHDEEVGDLAWDPEGERLVSVSRDGKVAVWLAETGESAFEIADRPGTAVAFSPNGDRIAVGGVDGRLALLDPGDGRVTAEMRWLDSAISGLAWSPEDQRIAAARMDGSVQIWDPQTGEIVLGLEGHRGPVHGICYSPDGEMVATAGNDGTVRIWETQSGTQLAAFEGDWSSVLTVAWSPDGDVIASGGMDGVVRLWDAETAEPLAVLAGRPSELIDATWSPSGDLIAAGADDGTVRIWDVTSGGIVHVLKGGRLPIADGSRLPQIENETSAPPDSEAGRIAMLRAFMKSLVSPLKARVSRVDVVSFSPNGKLIAAAIRGGVMRVWDVSTGQQRGPSFEHSDEVFDIAWAPDDEHLAVGLRDGRLLVWHVDSDQAQWIAIGHHGAINDVAWSPTGTKIATTGADGNVHIWEPAAARPSITLHGCAGRAGSVAWNPSGTRLAIANPMGAIAIVDSANGERLIEVELEAKRAMIVRLDWSPDGATLAAAGISFENGFTGEILLFAAETGRALDPLEGQSYYASSVSFDPQGKHLVSVGGAGLRLHRLSDGASISLDAFPLEDGRMGGVAYLASGLFEGDEAAFEHLRFRGGRVGRGIKLLSGADLIETFHHPGLLANFLLGAPLPAEPEATADE